MPPNPEKSNKLIKKVVESEGLHLAILQDVSDIKDTLPELETRLTEMIDTKISEVGNKIKEQDDTQILNSIATLQDEIKKKDFRGLTGKDGKQGIQGIAGKDGLNGKDGVDGKDGIDGKNGLDGIDGNTITEIEIRDKLETLTGEERLNIKHISGVDKVVYQDNLDKAISILDQRTQYLINKNTVASTSTGGGGSQTPWTSNIDGANYRLNNLGEPSAVTDGATRGYVDNHFKVFVTTYNNGSVNNINLASAPAVIDTITLTAGDKVLVAAQTSAIENGIYTFNGAGVAMTRTTGFTDDTSLRASIIQVNRGGANGRRTFANTNNFAITVGVTSITYGPLYNAGNFINFTGANTINVTNTGIVAGTYGNASSVPQFFSYSTGMLGSANNVPIAIVASQVTDFTSAVLAIVPPNVITRGRVVALARRI